jgi:hypothetical protein
VQIVFGVDGGNSKTDLVTASLDSEVVARVRGTGNNLHFAGVDATPEFLGQLAAQAGLGEPAARGVFYLCGMEIPADREALTTAFVEFRLADLRHRQPEVLADGVAQRHALAPPIRGACGEEKDLAAEHDTPPQSPESHPSDG